MEHVKLATMPSSKFIRMRQALLLQTKPSSKPNHEYNGDIIQQALNGINTHIPESNTHKILESNCSTLTEDTQKEEDRVVQLTISEDYPLFNSDQRLSLEDLLNSTEEKTDNSLDSLTTLLEVYNENEIQDISVPFKGNFTYASQIANGTQSIENSPKIVTPDSNGINSLSSVETVVSNQVSNSQRAPQIVLLRSANIKPKLIVKLNQNGLEHVDNSSKNVKLVVMDSFVVNNSTNSGPIVIAPQKGALPPLRNHKSNASVEGLKISKANSNQISSKEKNTFLKEILKPKPAVDVVSAAQNVIKSPSQTSPDESSMDVDDDLLPTSVILQPANISNSKPHPSVNTSTSGLGGVRVDSPVSAPEDLLHPSLLLQSARISAVKPFPTSNSGSPVQQLVHEGAPPEATGDLLSPSVMLTTSNVGSFKDIIQQTNSENSGQSCTILNDSGLLQNGKFILGTVVSHKPQQITESSERATKNVSLNGLALHKKRKVREGNGVRQIKIPKNSGVPSESTGPLAKNVAVYKKRKDVEGNSFCQVKILKNSEGSSEPTGRCTEDQLKKIQTAFQNGKLKILGGSDSSIVYDDEENIVCKLLYPEEFSQKYSDKEGNNKSKERIRKITKKSGRSPVENQKQVEEGTVTVVWNVDEAKLPRTRYGRLSRPPLYMFKNFESPDTAELDGEGQPPPPLPRPGSSEVVHKSIPELPEDSKTKAEDRTRLATNENKTVTIKSEELLSCPGDGQCPDHADPYPADVTKQELAKCSELADPSAENTMKLSEVTNSKSKSGKRSEKKKGRKKRDGVSFKSIKNLIIARRGRQLEAVHLETMKRFLAQCSDELVLLGAKDRLLQLMSPWDCLLERQSYRAVDPPGSSQVTGSSVVRGLLADLGDILSRLPSNLLHQVQADHPNAIHITDERLCRALDIKPGYYLGDDSLLRGSKPEDPGVPGQTGESSACLESPSELAPPAGPQPAPPELAPPASPASSICWENRFPASSSSVQGILDTQDTLGFPNLTSPSPPISPPSLPNCNDTTSSDSKMASRSHNNNNNNDLTLNGCFSNQSVPILAGKSIVRDDMSNNDEKFSIANSFISSESALAANDNVTVSVSRNGDLLLDENAVSVNGEDSLFGKDDNSIDLVDKKVSPDLSDILLDKSSIDTVDAILNDRLNELMPLDVAPLPDETPSIGRSIFSSHPLGLHSVSASTEDLLKSLENLAPELPSDPGPPVFDFSDLSADFGTDR